MSKHETNNASDVGNCGEQKSILMKIFGFICGIMKFLWRTIKIVFLLSLVLAFVMTRPHEDQHLHAIAMKDVEFQPQDKQEDASSTIFNAVKYFWNRSVAETKNMLGVYKYHDYYVFTTMSNSEGKIVSVGVLGIVHVRELEKK